MRSAVTLALIASVAGCIRTGTFECASGTLCPDGTVCATAPTGDLCVTPEQFTACDGHANLDDCGTGERCYEATQGLVCLRAGCANSFLDPEEQCDDGNNVAGDGCSADCVSNETCGNGEIDPLHGERCDDGGVLSSDGCSSRCIDELPRWRDAFEHSLSVGGGYAVTYDARRARIIAFGGTLKVVPLGGRRVTNDVYEWDGAWMYADPQTRPTLRGGVAFAYDERAGRAVLFGGTDEATLFADTWAWTGTDWSPIDAVGPPARDGAAMAYDPVEDRVVLYGGSGASALQDTWQLHDDVWTPLPMSMPAPPTAGAPALVFDRAVGRIALIASGTHWELDGTTWRSLGATPADPAKPTWLVFEAATKRRLLLAANPSDPVPQLHTWAWDGTAWVDLARPTVPFQQVVAVVGDAVRGGVYALGVGGTLLATWDADGALVASPPASVRIQPAQGAAGANDPERRNVVVFGGNTGLRAAPTLVATTHVFDGTRWTLVPPSGATPDARWLHAMVYDRARRQIVLFGGMGTSDVLGDTWTWDGARWTRSTAPGPEARAEHAMAYDGDRQRVVLFGGRNSAGTPLDDTWAWDGTSWTRIGAGALGSPSARLGAMLSEDPLGGGVVLFGGGQIELGDVVSPNAETWRLTTQWEPLAPVILPLARARGTLVWHPARRRLILVGGETSGTSMNVVPAFVDDAWEWDGARWRSLVNGARGITRQTAFLTPDGHDLMTFGGDALTGGSFELAVLGWDDGNAEETCAGRADADGDLRIGCDDPDCWSRCTPMCSPDLATCSAAPLACGDGTCAALEDARLCPADCGAPPVRCGDLVCDPGETCFGDCP